VLALRSEKKLVREAAINMIDYADGKRFIDPVVLYKGSKILEKAGVDLGDQWGITKYDTNPDGSLKKVGATKIKISETERMRRRDLGELNGKETSGIDKMKRLFDCYKL